ncbi:hypothetical protein N7468_007739 [Penicillium chermesinum]|uniref:Uncharacterized protein n=1 Tax=Penicillium chermesinum TaxID=63820 RepID=A0A9W9NUS2_9EURO|nr:uncharacterized protein N7468_007739 [Penicillium chermesinum]KAJ5226514.1 hypothetical protein N7468_007739 [Penicillium chermesinum]
MTVDEGSDVVVPTIAPSQWWLWAVAVMPEAMMPMHQWHLPVRQVESTALPALQTAELPLVREVAEGEISKLKARSVPVDRFHPWTSERVGYREREQGV